MADEQDNSQKTEDPSHKRLEDALKKGQVVTSREVNNFFILLALTFLITVLAPSLCRDLIVLLRDYIARPEDMRLNLFSLQQNMGELLESILILMLLPIFMAIGAVFAANLVQNRFVFSTHPIKPNFEKISVIKGIKRLFSRRNFVEFLKGIFKITLVGVIVGMVFLPYTEQFETLPDMDVPSIMNDLADMMRRIMIAVCIATFFIAIFDFAYQKFEYMQNLRMSKQEVKDEYKQQEGDPMVKQRLRQLRRERAAKQMMANVPQADVVITNPTHYAVALQYDSLTMNAPKVVAKGVDKVALRIREVAEDNKIMVMRNPPLARLLFDEAKLDEEIPYEYYKAVAEIIGYVYKLRGHKLPGAENKDKKTR